MRVLVVEDQPLARTRLVDLVRAEPDIEVVAACGTGREAVDEIRRQAPDVVLLDLQLEDLDGFGVLAEVGDAMPLTIFVTAYDEYALRAFEVHAFDYLLKPFGRERLRAALAAARQHLAEGREEQLARRFASLVAGVADPRRPKGRLVVRSGGRMVVVPLDELEAVESEGNYVRLHVGGRVHLVRETLSAVEARLGGERFCRVHRCWLVNLGHVEALVARPGGEPELLMRAGHRLRVGRAYRGQVMERWRARGPSRDALRASPGSSG
jgi:two-component system LytT family response regulator